MQLYRYKRVCLRWSTFSIIHARAQRLHGTRENKGIVYMWLHALECSICFIYSLLSSITMFICVQLSIIDLCIRRAKLGQIQGELQRAIQDLTKGGACCNNFFTFYALEIELFRVITLSN